MDIGSMITNLLRNLSSDDLGFSGDKCLANFPGLLITLLLWDRIVCCDGNRVTGLGWNVDTLLTLDLDWDWDTLLGGDVLTDLLAVVTSAVVLQVGDPALHVFYCLNERL